MREKIHFLFVIRIYFFWKYLIIHVQCSEGQSKCLPTSGLLSYLLSYLIYGVSPPSLFPILQVNEILTMYLDILNIAYHSGESQSTKFQIYSYGHIFLQIPLKNTLKNPSYYLVETGFKVGFWEEYFLKKKPLLQNKKWDKWVFKSGICRKIWP